VLKRGSESFNRLSFEKRLEIKERIKRFQRNQTKSKKFKRFQTAEFSLFGLLITCHHDLTGPILAQQVQTRS
jgi:hypothetical protein